MYWIHGSPALNRSKTEDTYKITFSELSSLPQWRSSWFCWLLFLILSVSLFYTPHANAAVSFEIYDQPLNGADSIDGLSNSTLLAGELLADSNENPDLATTGTDTSGTRQLIVFKSNDDGKLSSIFKPLNNNGLSNGTIVSQELIGDTSQVDLVASGSNRSDSPDLVLIENTGSSFSSETGPVTQLPATHNGDLSFAEVTGDTMNDVVIAGETGGGTPVLTVFAGTESGSYPVHYSDFTDIDSGLQHAELSWIDSNNNGFKDLSVLGIDQSNNVHLTLYINDGTGNFDQTKKILGDFGLSRGDLGWSDYDGDDEIDLAAVGRDKNGNPRLILFQNDGLDFNVDTQPHGPEDGYDSSSLLWTDVENDGDSDLMVMGRRADSSVDMSLYLNDGDGNFSDTEILNGDTITGLMNGDIVSDDFDGDGRTDLILAGQSSNNTPRLSLLRNLTQMGGNDMGENDNENDVPDDTDLEDEECLIERSFSWKDRSHILTPVRSIRDRLLTTPLGRFLTRQYYDF